MSSRDDFDTYEGDTAIYINHNGYHDTCPEVLTVTNFNQEAGEFVTLFDNGGGQAVYLVADIPQLVEALLALQEVALS